MDKAMVKDLPKVELHCHLDGSLSLPCLRQLAEMAAIDLPESDEDLLALVTAPSDCQSLNDYLTVFDVVRPLLQTKEALTLAAYDVARQAAQENVIYTEIRFAPELSLDQGLTVAETIAAVCQGLNQAQEEFGIVAKALICGMRQSSLDLNEEIFQAAKGQLGQTLVGGDFAGNEADYPTADLADFLSHVQDDLAYPMTFHAGECQCPCPANIARAVELGVKRIGHGTAAYNQPELIEDLVANEVTVELCLISNLQTKAAPSIEAFPYLALKQAGARLTINTDNRTVSQTNLVREYEAFMTHFKTNLEEFYHYNRYALEASFASLEEKAELFNRLAEGYQSHLKQ
ncbi:adenosine deaminase [Streptococcus cuniculipharyngis]|uniref:Adenosine deaminase n=1 Tax=Streptococcus cuniculipharyngis TaxID=1562651 RepID=A0A5C5SFG2_9STRE|nr:adenosine deaminase [Streptococcus cuniculipharyngis]TWS99030.1 adenosine deaminase [Streptococcus cuniculipharyngis]